MSTEGEVRYVSWELPRPRKSLSTMAKPPLPPVRFPRESGSSNSQPPKAVSSATVQPAGVPVVSKDSVRPWWPRV